MKPVQSSVTTLLLFATAVLASCSRPTVSPPGLELRVFGDRACIPNLYAPSRLEAQDEGWRIVFVSEASDSGQGSFLFISYGEAIDVEGLRRQIERPVGSGINPPPKLVALQTPKIEGSSLEVFALAGSDALRGVRLVHSQTEQRYAFFSTEELFDAFVNTLGVGCDASARLIPGV